MSKTAIHDGHRLEWWVKKKFKSIDEFLKKMEWDNYSNLYYWTSKREIKIEQKEKFCEALGITTDEFAEGYNTAKKNELEESAAGYGKSLHHGQNLKAALEKKHINLTSFAKELEVGRSTLYNWFDQEELDVPTLYQLSQASGIPIATIKGVATGDRAFEKDIYQQLQKIASQNEAILQKLDKLASA